MGILNRTPDSFYDKGATFSLDALLERADRLVGEGADILDVGGVKAGPGPEVTEAEELDRVVPAIEALHARVDVALSVDTWRASVAAAAYGPVRCSATTSAGSRTPTTCRPRPEPAPRWWRPTSGSVRGSPTPSPSTTTWWCRCAPSSPTGPHRARSAGLGADRIVLDAGLDLGKTAAQSLALLRASPALCRARVPAAAVGVEQDLSRRDPRPRHRPPGRRVVGGRRRSASPWAAASCGPTTSPAPGACATPWPQCSRRP